MRRRALLAGLGGAAVPGLAGCLGDDAPGTGDPTTDRRTTDTTTPHDTVTDPQPDPPDLGVPPAESPCPVFDPADTGRVVCTAAGERSPETMALVASAASVATPRGSVSFTLRNDADVRFDTNFYAWRLWKRVDGAWHYVVPRTWNEPLMLLDPGGSHEWTLTVDNRRLDEPLPDPGGTSELTVAGLGGGAYAFGVDGWFPSAGHEHRTAFAARFRVEGPPVELRPTDEVTGTSRDGDTVTVGTDVDATDDTRPCEFEVTRVAGADGHAEARERIVEQLLRDRRLRNTLPFFESGVETVRLVEPDGTVPPFGVTEPFVVAFDGQRYRVTAREL